MRRKIEILPIKPHSALLRPLAVEARRDGYRFVDRLIEEALDGRNSFTGEGECFLGIFEDGELVGCGGVNKDPYVIQHVGRLRHVYVLSSARRKGLATELVRELLRRCEHSFSVFRLRTSDKNADAFYERFGFERSNDEDASHFLATR